jgi:hypothetical protein
VTTPSCEGVPRPLTRSTTSGIGRRTRTRGEPQGPMGIAARGRTARARAPRGGGELPEGRTASVRTRARLALWPARRRRVVSKLIQLALFEMEKLQKFEKR